MGISTSLDANGSWFCRMRCEGSCVVDDQAVDFVRDVLETVGHAFEMAEKFARDQKTHRVRGPMLIEQALEARGVDLVGMTLHPHEPLGDRKSFVEGQSESGRVDLGGRRISKNKK